jgi:diguanylate cyclase (GGDEF)-like protein
MTNDITPMPFVKIMEAIEQACESCRGDRLPSSLVQALLLLDLDRFAEFNSRLGYQQGDLFLKQIATAISKCLNQNEQILWMGGEEFLVLIRDLLYEETVYLTEILRRKVANVERPSEVDSLPLTVSIGVTLVQPTDSFELLMNRSEQALLAAKGAGKGQIWICHGDEPQPLSCKNMGRPTTPYNNMR